MRLRQATPDELQALALEAHNDDAIGSIQALETLAASGPWKVQLSEEGDAIVFERWREHLDWLSMRAVWAAPSRLPAIVEASLALALEHGYSCLLSPLIAEELSTPYMRAGMQVATRLVVLRRGPTPEDVTAPEPPLPPGVVLSEGSLDSLEEILRLDQRCFEPLWAYDRQLLGGYLMNDRVVEARDEDARLVGFTMSSIEGSQGSLGRLGVDPAMRRRGLAKALVADAARALAWQGIGSVTLTTQVENAPARALYAACGFDQMRGTLVALTIEV